jgi:two-component system, OmpR family, KDP operon response regulator KdpE
MNVPSPLVLVVEDEPAMSRLITSMLSSAGYRVFPVATGSQALLQASSRTPDVVLLDLGLPDVEGLEVVRKLRQWARMPIVVVSARGREQDKVDALDAGADDYLTKPFGASELLARVRVALRHSARGTDGVAAKYDVDGIQVDVERRQVTVRGREVRLTPTEWKLLGVLVKNAGRVVLQSQLLREVWGPVAERQGQSHYLRVYVAALRRKLEQEPAHPRCIITEAGVGYRLKDET